MSLVANLCWLSREFAQGKKGSLMYLAALFFRASGMGRGEGAQRQA